ncbi:MAG: hypothetical protein GOMPHAMPRED_004933 [Gomphillus americanus]|uniref:Uncharacterized protein n=1 Tax=Gomphillus americanus TaxID=1940652 RepID=A0A8H3EHR7_9LECA|nr:MAG: hypothetical protein GOMPHAMPRED_004933 [Gomphillus americanus]
MAKVPGSTKNDTAQGTKSTISRPGAKALGLLNIPILHSPIHRSFANGDVEEHENEELGYDAQTMVGVSMSRAQTNLLSSTISTAEKTAAFDSVNTWGFFDDRLDEEHEGMIRDSLYAPLMPDGASDSPPLHAGEILTSNEPSPRSSEPTPRIALHPSEHPALEPTQIVEWGPWQRSRSRAVSAASLLGDIKKFIPGLSQSNKTPTQPSRLESRGESIEPTTRVGRSNSIFGGKMSWASNLSLRPASQDRTSGQSTGNGHRRIISSPMMPENSTLSQIQATSSGHSTPLMAALGTFQNTTFQVQKLRRSASYDSLPLSLLSRVSSIDNYNRFAHIDSQVNTRVKAIRDTIADNLPSISTLNFSAFKPEFSFSKVGSVALPKSISTVFSGSTSSQDKSDTLSPSLSRTTFTNPRYPNLEEALQNLTGDVVVLGGYRGSTLRSAEPPHRQLWAPIKIGFGMRNVDLEVGLNPEDELTMEDRIFPSGMLTNVGPIDISKRLLARLKKCPNSKNGTLRVVDWGYDWRLSPALLARKLTAFLETLQCNQPGVSPESCGATVIAHSLGGLITRRVVNDRPELFAGVVYAGTPQFCVNILGPFRNGDDVLLSSRILTAQVNFTLRTSFVLLPESGQCFIDINDTQTQYHVDFFNVDTWKKYALSPCISRTLPVLTQSESRRSLFGALPTFASQSTGRSSPSDLSEKIESKAKTISHPAENTLDLSIGPSTSIATTSTLRLPDALTYLERTLKETLAFKKSLQHKPEHQQNNVYPPMSVLYSTSLPTVYGAKVASRDGIARADAYDNLAFASGDGVVLARAAMLPKGYKCAPGGRVRTGRGHVGMLSDLDAVGKCLSAIIRARKTGVGLGSEFAAAVDEHGNRKGRGGGGDGTIDSNGKSF